MKLRALAVGAAATALFAMPQVAEAYWAQVLGNLNLRTCASASCAKITVMPRGATVWVDGAVGGWYHLTYGRASGFASARYIGTGAPPFVGPSPFYRPYPYPYYYRGPYYYRPGLFFGFRFGN